MVCGLWFVGCGLWVVGCGLWVVGCGLGFCGFEVGLYFKITANVPTASDRGARDAPETIARANEMAVEV